MTTHAVGSPAASTPSQAVTYTQFAGVCALLTGAAGLGYAVAFILLRHPLLSALFLLLFGLLSTVVLIAVYQRIRPADESFSLWALVLSMIGALGGAVHGGYDLANALHPPSATLPDLPSPIDPRGLLTFGAAGIALFVIAWLMGRTGRFPRTLSYLGMLSAVLLIALYLGRLIVLDAASPIIVVPAIVNGFVLAPAWYIWLGLVFWRRAGQ